MSGIRDKKISLSEKLSSLIQTKPSAIESDDDLTTVDKFAPKENDSEYSADELDVPTIRRINNVLLEDEDKKYSGTGTFRKNLNDSLDSDSNEDEDDSINEAGHEEMSDHKTEENDDTMSEAEVRSYRNNTRDNLKTNKKKQEDENFNKDLFIKAGSDIEKGKAITNQLHIWDFLLKCRMKFQKCLITSNLFPNHKTFSEFKSRGGPLFQDSVNQCKRSLRHLLNSLLIFQSVLLNSNEEFVNSNSNERKLLTSNDEEVSSESEKEENITEKETHPLKKRLKTLKDFSEEISERHATFQCYRNKTIQKWNEKTRIGYISSKNFSAFEQSILKHIEHILLDRQRLVKRTQTKRSDYHILGEDDEPPPKKSAIESNENSLVTSMDSRNRGLYKEIFDDDDFYHQLLSEMVKRKASDVTDPVQLGRQWMQLQKIRSKMKKSVDTKASKGRKVRFVVHPKLVNFMMPIDNSNYSKDSKTELVNSLFGKVKK